MKKNLLMKYQGVRKRGEVTKNPFTKVNGFFIKWITSIYDAEN